MQVKLNKIQQLQHTVQTQYQCDPQYWSVEYAHSHDVGHPQSPGRNTWVEATSSMLLSLKFLCYLVIVLCCAEPRIHSHILV